MCVVFFFLSLCLGARRLLQENGKISENSVDFPSTVDNTIQVVIEDLILHAMTLKADVKTGHVNTGLQRVKRIV